MHLRQAMRDAVTEAGAIVMRHYGRSRGELKDDDTLVSEADTEVDAFLAERAAVILPEAAYLGEESAADEGAVQAARESEWAWVADPVDGTAAFLDGIETFCVCLGLLKQGEPHAGAVWFPALKHLYEAVRGEGAWYDGRPARVLSQRREWDRTVLYVDIDAHIHYRIDWRGKTRNLGSAALHYLLVARERTMGAISTARVWDYVAAAAIVKEAGGIMRHLDGAEINWRAVLDGRPIKPPVFAAPPITWDDLAARITYLG